VATSAYPSLAPSTTSSPSRGILPSSSPSLDDAMYIVNMTDISQLDGDNDKKWIPRTQIFIANRNEGSGDISYLLEGTNVEATYQKGDSPFPTLVNCDVDSEGGCILESSSSVNHFFINNNNGADSAKFIVTDIDNPISEYNAEFNEVDTTLVVWDPVATSAYPSLAPSTTSSPSRGILPSSSPSLDDAMYLKNIVSVVEISVGSWTATFELIIDNINPNAADANYVLEGTLVTVQYIYGTKKRTRILIADADGICTITTVSLPENIDSVDLTVLKIANRVSSWQPGLFDKVGVTKTASGV